PEQCHGAEKVDARSDIYSVACIIYEMACGRPPFTGNGMGEILGKHQFVEPVAPRSLVPDLPAELEQAILHGLAKDVAARPQTIGELAREIDPTPSGQEPAVVPAPRLDVAWLPTVPPAAAVPPTVAVAPSSTVAPALSPAPPH